MRNEDVVRRRRWGAVVLLGSLGLAGGCDCGGGDSAADGDAEIPGETADDGWDGEGRDGEGRDGDGGDAGPCETAADCPRGPCEEPPQCIDGVCVPVGPRSCEDGIACTADRCDPDRDACVHVPDHTLCGAGEICVVGEGCVRVPCTRPVDCDDGLACNGVETCDAAAGICVPGTPPCGDGIACTEDPCEEPGTCLDPVPEDARCESDEVCDPGAGCVPRCEDVCPDDGLVCNGAPVCVDGRCLPDEAPVCPDDAVSCTVPLCMEGPAPRCALVPHHELCAPGELCDAEVGCEAAPDCATSCDDGFFCNGAEACTEGRCASGTPPVCDDGVDCTLSFCDEDTDACRHVAVDARCPAGRRCDPRRGCTAEPCTAAACDDGNPCNGTETCNLVTGLCESGAPRDCDDGVACTRDTCDEATGGCFHVPDHGLCDGGVCDPAAGGCVPGRLCPGGDADCQDGVYCNGPEVCDRTTHICRAGVPPACDDGVACTVDGCDEALSGCRHTPADSFCDDGDFCNGREQCAAGTGCVAGTPESCDDGDPCTVDVCETPAGGGGRCVNRTLDRDGDRFGPGAACGGDCDDGNAARHPDAPEVCNGVDDDCDTTVDETFACVRGATRDCTTVCGSPGVTTCGTSCTWGACAPLAETCNGRDDDCDGETDEGFDCAAGATRPCAIGSCAGGGYQTCSPVCAWEAECHPYEPYVEVCDTLDNDCDGVPDDGFPCVQYSSGTCTTTCGSTGSRTCSATCTWGPCAVPREECNGRDDDCDTRVDNGFDCPRGGSGPCTTSCGTTGSRVCDARCAWGDCTPPAETCNGRDDDCDTLCDNGFPCCAGAAGEPCLTTCGSTGTRSCSPACAWGACVPPAETCNGRDDDCDTLCDDGFPCCAGSSGSCTTVCGTTGSRVCTSSCGWEACVAPPETCNGRDDDCDGGTDNTFLCQLGERRGCTTALGCPGTQRCDEACMGWEPCESIGTPPANDACAGAVPIAAPGGRFRGSTCPGADDFSGSCGGTGALDVVYRFTLAVRSDVLLHTVGSSFDTALYVRRGSCAAGPEVACDAGRFRLGSFLQLVDLPPDTYYVFVDGAAPARAGEYQLEVSISPHDDAGESCGHPAASILTASQSVPGSTTPFENDATGTCRLASDRDVVYALYLDRPSFVVLDTCTSAPTYDTFLYVRDVCTSSDRGNEFGCNDQAIPACAEGPDMSRITIPRLEAGMYYVFVDGAAGRFGDYVLHVDITPL